VIATIAGILFVKIFNLFLSKDNKINPLIGNAGVSAVPDSARISQVLGLEYDPSNYLLMHAMGPNVAGVIGRQLLRYYARIFILNLNNTTIRNLPSSLILFI
jgi:Na+-transporting methylmalonyl-CoA/oxaloacetate decarboxylase beta subunit